MSRISRKTATVPKIRVEVSRRARYQAAFHARRRTDPDLHFSDWCRQALDAAASLDLGNKDGPHPKARARVRPSA
jgi:hypothetical protein